MSELVVKTPRQFVIFRRIAKNDGKDDGGLSINFVKASFSQYFIQTANLPVSVRVNHKQRDKVANMLDELGLHSVLIVSIGGCLLNEIWFSVPDKIDLAELIRKLTR